MFGYTEEQIANFGLSFGVGAFMLYMVFIISSWHVNQKPAASAPSCSSWRWASGSSATSPKASSSTSSQEAETTDGRTKRPSASPPRRPAMCPRSRFAPSAHVQAAVAGEIGAGRETRILARQPGHDGADLARRAQALDRDRLDDLLQHMHEAQQ